MDILWDCPEQLCAREVLGHLTSHTLAYTTVATVLTNLVKKGMVERIIDGRTWAHRPMQTRSQYAAGLMAQALTISGDPAASSPGSPSAARCATRSRCSRSGTPVP